MFQNYHKIIDSLKYEAILILNWTTAIYDITEFDNQKNI